MSRELEDRIADIATRQHGVVTRAQLVEAGLSSSAVSRRLTSGRIRRLHRGLYLAGPIPGPRYLEMAAVLASGPDSVVSHLTAASMWGIRSSNVARQGSPSPNSYAEPVDITLAGGNRGRRPGIRTHRVVRLETHERTVREGVPVTTPARTLADLAGIVGSRELENAVARAEREGLVTREALSGLLVRGRRGTEALRAVLRAHGGAALTRSEAESRLLTLLRQAGLPPPATNVKVGRYEIDFLWRAEGIALEVDGFQHHSLRPRFEGDRRKDAWLLAAGIKVVRLSWRQITRDAMATAVQVGQALALARRDPV